MRHLKILTWHIHGNYLLYLSRVPHDIYLPVKPGAPEGYGGRAGSFPWPENVHDIPADKVRELEFDCILFQSRKNYEKDQHEILSPQQQRLPRIYLEHDPPLENPTDQPHWVDDPDILLVHVTPFNELMWSSGRTPTLVIDHGVFLMQDVNYTGEIERGIVIVNHLKRRGRRVGADIFERARQQVPLDLIGMGWEEIDGLGEVSPPELPAFAAGYRFFFNPIRWTSMGLAVIEAMMIGLPIIGMATTEMSMAIENGVSGYVDTNVTHLIERMRELLRHPEEARRLGEGARRYAHERFNINRFINDWDAAFRFVTGGVMSVSAASTSGSSSRLNNG
jgi:glycosyltransferase involved in cell wall biosynthesis